MPAARSQQDDAPGQTSLSQASAKSRHILAGPLGICILSTCRSHRPVEVQHAAYNHQIYNLHHILSES
eukprot:9496206-Pyramimonas_sp.AAC.1